MNHRMGQPGLIASAFTPAYEAHLSSLGKRDLLAEYELVVVTFTLEATGPNCERVKLARREIARRIPPENLASQKATS